MAAWRCWWAQVRRAGRRAGGWVRVDAPPLRLKGVGVCVRLACGRRVEHWGRLPACAMAGHHSRLFESPEKALQIQLVPLRLRPTSTRHQPARDSAVERENPAPVLCCRLGSGAGGLPLRLRLAAGAHGCCACSACHACCSCFVAAAAACTLGCPAHTVGGLIPNIHEAAGASHPTSGTLPMLTSSCAWAEPGIPSPAAQLNCPALCAGRMAWLHLLRPAVPGTRPGTLAAGG